MRLRGVPLAFGLIAAWDAVEAWRAWASSATRGSGLFVLLGLHATLTMAVAAIFTVSTARRPPSRRRAREPVALLACAVALLAVVPADAAKSHAPMSLLLVGDALAVVASLWIVASALALGRCFGILPEARGLVTRGPYRVVRHPVYLGEIGAMAGLTVAALSLGRVAMLVVFAGAQVVRMGLEESALKDAFPQYAEYAERTPRLVPKLGVRGRGVAALRTPASALLTVLVCAVAIGCASKSDPQPIRVPHTHIARRDARAVARAVTIRADDLPEFKATAKHADRREVPLPGEARCLRRADGKRSPEASTAPSRGRWAYARSVTLSAGSGYHSLGAMSEVSVMPTARAARSGVAEAIAMGRACVARLLKDALAKRLHVPVRGVVVEPLAVKIPGADNGGAHQVIVASRRMPLIWYVDWTTFSYGQDVISLVTHHTSKPVPPAMDERLIGLLLKRAQAHGG
jgi:protein-S-isoprenylcysteine O-methyltransferase Ste14